MTDIINRAKDLVESTPIGPDGWECELMPGYGYCVVDPGRHLVGDFYSREDYALMAAAAPALAQALAEETWEYSAQYRNDYTNGWKFLEELQGRWGTRETLTSLVEGNLHRFYDNIRIVRRRVSPPEVINE